MTDEATVASNVTDELIVKAAALSGWHYASAQVIRGVADEETPEGRTARAIMAHAKTLSAPPSDALREECERLTLEHGPIVIDKYGEALAWRPLDYGTWTEFAHLSGYAGSSKDT